ncbi:GNAT family N-acetyltransferase [Mesorhizobium sp. M1403]|uniref:GNAT family N-acetyltransferase n=1 Tax=Mesorhizobium sp. M1403 TaxID=2957097 RepID=UPI00333AA1A5
MKRLVLSFASLLLAETAFAFPVTVDSCGTPLTFDAAPKRAVIQDLNMAEMAFALGLQPSIVGLTGITGWYKVGPEFKAEQGAIPELAPKYPTLENLVAVEPDFFFAGWYYGMKPGGEVTPDTLAPHGIKTLVLTESCVHLDQNRPAASMDLLYGDVEKLGKIFGKEAEAGKLVSNWKAQLADITAKIGDRTGTRVFLYDSGEDKPFTSGKFAIPSASVFVVRQSDAVAKLRLLYVEPSARGLGIGKRLVEECIGFCRDTGYRTLTLWTNDVLTSARRIYEAAGFKLTNEERHHSFGKDLVGQNWNLEL